MSLPAVAGFKMDAKKPRPPRVLIVQAEVAADGRVTYGIVTQTEIRAVAGDELTGTKSFADLEKKGR